MSEQTKKRVHIDKELLDKLQAIALEKKIRPSMLLEGILVEYIRKSKLDKEDLEEKRRFRRKKVAIPAMVYESSEEPNVGRYFSTTIYDVSLGGICLAFPLERYDKIEFIKTNSSYEVICYLSDPKTLSRFKCTPQHVKKNEYTLKVGGSLLGASRFSHDQFSECIM